MIGVNRFLDDVPDPKIETHPYDYTTAERQIKRTQGVRRERDAIKFDLLMEQLVAIAKDPAQNVMPITIELVRAGATMGDIVECLKGVWAPIARPPSFDPTATSGGGLVA